VTDSNNLFSYNFYYWGPLLFKIKLRPDDLKACAKLCSKKASLINNTLAGVIKHEHYVSTRKYYKVLDPYLNSFRRGYKQWYGEPLVKKTSMVAAWVNFMVAGEFNPPHIHGNCAFSSVLFVKIPKKLKEENKKFRGKGGGPGSLSFIHGVFQPYAMNSKYFLPEEGDLFIFPATLFHFVAPFMSEGERISMSANFKLD